MSDELMKRWMDGVEARLDTHDEKLDKILQHVSAAKGTWRTLAVLGAAVVGLGTLIGVLVDWLKA